MLQCAGLTAVHVFILKVSDVPSKPFPRDIMNWSETIFKPAFQKIGKCDNVRLPQYFHWIHLSSFSCSLCFHGSSRWESMTTSSRIKRYFTVHCAQVYRDKESHYHVYIAIGDFASGWWQCSNNNERSLGTSHIIFMVIRCPIYVLSRGTDTITRHHSPTISHFLACCLLRFRCRRNDQITELIDLIVTSWLP